MTALPTRCRNVNDALREPVSAAASRVRLARAECDWSFDGFGAFGFLSRRLMRQAPRPALRGPRRRVAVRAAARPLARRDAWCHPPTERRPAEPGPVPVQGPPERARQVQPERRAPC